MIHDFQGTQPFEEEKGSSKVYNLLGKESLLGSITSNGKELNYQGHNLNSKENKVPERQRKALPRSIT